MKSQIFHRKFQYILLQTSFKSLKLCREKASISGKSTDFGSEKTSILNLSFASFMTYGELPCFSSQNDGNYNSICQHRIVIMMKWNNKHAKSSGQCLMHQAQWQTQVTVQLRGPHVLSMRETLVQSPAPALHPTPICLNDNWRIKIVLLFSSSRNTLLVKLEDCWTF